MTDDQNLSRAQAILADLLAFPTLSGSSNLKMISYLRDHLEAFGADVRIYPDQASERANLFATIGPDRPGGVVLSGHSDVVPVEGQPWTVEPFALTERKGRLVGRGAADMKGFIACVMAMAPDFAKTDLRRPLHIAISYDEEIGCLGAEVLLRGLAKDGFRPAIAIIGEPTEMGIVEGHKGCYEYTTEFIGLEGHSANPDQGVSAIDCAVRFVGRLHELRAELRAKAPPASRYTPPCTTVHVGCISGGTARNVIPRQCRVDWEIRPVQTRDAEYVKDVMAKFVSTDLEPAMIAVHPKASIVTQTICEVQSLEPALNSEARDLMRSLTGNKTADVAPFATEAGLFQGAGMSSIVCGPGSIRQAHMADEFIELRQLEACLAMLDGLRSGL